jgi:hypothetical protein
MQLNEYIAAQLIKGTRKHFSALHADYYRRRT